MKPTNRAKRAFFCVVQFAPSTKSAMARNIGLLLVCTECRFIQGMFMSGYKRLLAALAPESPDTHDGRSSDCMPGNKNVARRSFRDLAELKNFLCTLSGNIKLAESSSADVTNPYSELSTLYDRYVVHQNRLSARRRQTWPDGRVRSEIEGSAELGRTATAGQAI